MSKAMATFYRTTKGALVNLDYVSGLNKQYTCVDRNTGCLRVRADMTMFCLDGGKAINTEEPLSAVIEKLQDAGITII